MVMNDALLLILSIVGFFALYWALIGQWKHNKVFSSENTLVSEENQNFPKGNKVFREEHNIIVENSNISKNDKPNKSKEDS